MNFVLAKRAKDVGSIQLEYPTIVSSLDIIGSDEISWDPLVFLLSWTVFICQKRASAMQFDGDTSEKGLAVEL